MGRCNSVSVESGCGLKYGGSIFSLGGEFSLCHRVPGWVCHAGNKSAESMKLITHLQLASRLKMFCTKIPLLGSRHGILLKNTSRCLLSTTEVGEQKNYVHSLTGKKMNSVFNAPFVSIH